MRNGDSDSMDMADDDDASTQRLREMVLQEAAEAVGLPRR
jgi:hypothetical protein